MNIKPSQKLGMDCPSIAPSIRVPSVMLPRRVAASTPIGKATMVDSKKPQMVNSRVAGMRSHDHAKGGHAMRQRVAGVALRQVYQEIEVLHMQRTVKAEALARRLAFFFAGALADIKKGGVARHVDGQEGQQRYAENDNNG